MPLRAKIRWPKDQTFTTGPNGFIKFWNTENGVGRVMLDRANKLNALTHDMSRSILNHLDLWNKDPRVKAIVVDGAGERAFCAGGDITEGAEEIGTRDEQVFAKMMDSFSEEFSLNHIVAVYPKPYISILDGITMGGGVGLSVHGSFRIATERTKFAMPETRIGFFCDVGSSFFMSKMKDNLGRYLALTSDTLDGYDNVVSGVATHYIESKDLGKLYDQLAAMELHDTDIAENYKRVQKLLDDCCQNGPPENYQFKFKNRKIEILRNTFGESHVEDIISKLEKYRQAASEEEEFITKTIKTISEERSPTSVKITLELLNRARNQKSWSIKRAVLQDCALSKVVLQLPDYLEGVDALLNSKPSRTPIWNPKHVNLVDDQFVQSLFHKTDTDPIPIDFRIDKDIFEYPWGFNTVNWEKHT